MKKERLTITIDQELNAAIREISKNEHRSISQMISMIIKEYIKKEKSE